MASKNEVTLDDLAGLQVSQLLRYAAIGLSLEREMQAEQQQTPTPPDEEEAQTDLATITPIGGFVAPTPPPPPPEIKRKNVKPAGHVPATGLRQVAGAYGRGGPVGTGANTGVCQHEGCENVTKEKPSTGEPYPYCVVHKNDGYPGRCKLDGCENGTAMRPSGIPWPYCILHKELNFPGKCMEPGCTTGTAERTDGTWYEYCIEHAMRSW